MKRPFIFCHMFVSLDGKIEGPYMDTEEATASGDLFYAISFGEKPYYKHQGWLSGRATTDDNFTFYEKPDLKETFSPVPAGDYIIKTNKPMYYISIDPSGRLGWKCNTITYRETKAQVIEVLTEKVSDQYKSFLRDLAIPYIIAGESNVDPVLAVEKLSNYFHMETIMLGGGGVLNWSFIQAGMCDELSVVMTPVADGSSDKPSLFDSREGLSSTTPVVFDLINCQVEQDGTIWLRYAVKK